MAWYDIHPSWQTDNTADAFRRSFEAVSEARLFPLRMQAAKNALKEQSLSMVTQGLANQQKSMQLDLAHLMAPLQVQQAQDDAKLGQMKIEALEQEQQRFSDDLELIKPWMSKSFEDRIDEPVPLVQSAKALGIVQAQQRADENLARTQEMHDAAIERARNAAQAATNLEEYRKQKLQQQKDKINGAAPAAPKKISKAEEIRLRVQIAKDKALLARPGLDDATRGSISTEIAELARILRSQLAPEEAPVQTPSVAPAAAVGAPKAFIFDGKKITPVK